jgi:hypothetical protein
MLILAVLDVGHFSESKMPNRQFNFLRLFSKKWIGNGSEWTVAGFKAPTREDFAQEILSRLSEIKKFCHDFSKIN